MAKKTGELTIDDIFRDMHQRGADVQCLNTDPEDVQSLAVAVFARGPRAKRLLALVDEMEKRSLRVEEIPVKN